ncbi:probable cation-transporting ATPase 13A4 [Hemiscyllium ocellatum]|uniref:probable cation-transporting ATPase 13A4 n=1 Tax=Hemiscyllium ocellatum TaxID=170820 RepID=UPI002966AFEB|nr:probable cation-transporting ATPase 13A4 [Hemiscyllium ocellatum]
MGFDFAKLTVMNYRQALETEADGIMEFNADKCEVIHFGRSSKTRQYSMDGKTLGSSEEQRDLGMVVHISLTARGQANRADRTLGFISHGIEYKSMKDIFGYKSSRCRSVLFVIGSILTCGFLLLLFYWRPEWDVWSKCIQCTLQEADIVLLRTTDEFKIWTKKKVMWVQLSFPSSTARAAQQHSLFSDETSLLHRIVTKPDLKVRFIEIQKIRYIWDLYEKQFIRAEVLEDRYSCADTRYKFGSGLTTTEEATRRLIFGPNVIDIRISPIWKLLCKEVLNPFYTFQIFSVCLWLSEDYTEYSVALIIMSFISIAFSVYDVRQQSIKLYRLVESHNNMMVTICRKGGGYAKVPSSELVPGDVFIVTGNKQVLSCDAILIHGGCIVNESMLTGESIPVTKTPLPSTVNCSSWKSSTEDYKRHTLFCGTQVIQSKATSEGGVRAVVYRTGFTTTKGELVRSILYPKPIDFKLYQDAFRFLLCLAAIATIGMIYSVCILVLNGIPPGKVVRKALDVITIAVSPALPASVTIGIIYAQERLKKKGIYCINPQRINMCGQLNLICFDKTGTLTEDGLDLWGLVSTKGKGLQNILRFNNGDTIPWGPLFGAMVSCHSLVLLDNTLQGDPLDLKMFEITRWELKENTMLKLQNEETHSFIVKPGPKADKVSKEGVIVLKQYPFSPTLQRMSVITQVIGKEKLTVYLKGAPEMVTQLCKPETVPRTFSTELQRYTKQGFRVIGFAFKSLWNGRDINVGNLTREDVESDLVFLGLMILENKLKPQTIPVLSELSKARIRTVMITGDNLQTAVTVARNAGMIPLTHKIILIEASKAKESGPAVITWKIMENGKNTGQICTDETNIPINGFVKKKDFHFAMTGKSYNILVQHFNHLLPKLLVSATVFARMSPAQKGSLIEEFQKMDYFVGMCGDGANDCGALKIAHAGISLSEQEASVASPFTSKIPSIDCVPQLIKEGRAALVSSFCIFKYMALYSMIQYVGVLCLYWQANTFGNYQFLFEDLAIATVIGITMSFNHAYPQLDPNQPPGQLISPPLLLSVILNVILSLVLHVFGFIMVQQQSWYTPRDIYRACNPTNLTSDGKTTSNKTSDTIAIALKNEDSYKSYENTTVYLLSLFNCISTAIVFSKGKPYRKPIYTNYIFMIVLLAQFGTCLYFLFGKHETLYNALDLVCTPRSWRVYLLVMVLVHFAVIMAIEEILIENRCLKVFLTKCCKVKSTQCYKKMQRIITKEPNWPPEDDTDYTTSCTMDEVALEAYSNMNYEHDKDSKTASNGFANTTSKQIEEGSSKKDNI